MQGNQHRYRIDYSTFGRHGDSGGHGNNWETAILQLIDVEHWFAEKKLFRKCRECEHWNPSQIPEHFYHETTSEGYVKCLGPLPGYDWAGRPKRPFTALNTETCCGCLLASVDGGGRRTQLRLCPECWEPLNAHGECDNCAVRDLNEHWVGKPGRGGKAIM